MRVSPKWGIFAIAAAVVAFAGPASAQALSEEASQAEMPASAAGSEPNFGSPFDDRYWIGIAGGVGITDSEDYDNGVAGIVSFGKTLYPNLLLQIEGQYENISVASVGNSGQSADYTRFGGALTAQYLFNIGRVQFGPMAGASLRRIDFLGTEEDGLGLHTGLGAILKVGKNVDLTFDARYLIDFVDGTDTLPESTFYTWNGLIGVRLKLGTWPPPAPDSDGDGVPDYRDDCPNTPAGAIVNARGCALDSDADGVPDYSDSCPNTPPGVPVDSYGCPLDSDGDGVPDISDECPDTPAGVEVDARGCPLDTDQDGVVNAKDLCPNTPFGAEVDVHGCPFDTDQDGVPDFRDACPNTPFGTPVNDRGCALDSDGDGVPDSIDQCPNTYPGVEVDEVGCPIKNQVLVLNNVHFEFDRADLLPDSRNLLSKVAKSLMDQPELRIEVAGHTDSMGSDEYNLRLSNARAASVRRYLVSEGVNSSNIYSRGYGERQPVATNETDAGRAQNRRVEIHLLDE